MHEEFFVPTENTLERHEEAPAPKTCAALLQEYMDRVCIEGIYPTGTLLNVDMPGLEAVHRQTGPYQDASTQDPVLASELTCYNVAGPDGEGNYYGRAESAKSEGDSVAVPMVEVNHVLRPLEGAPTFALQDPFHFDNINGWQVFGGVQIYERDPEHPGNLGYRTVFYKYKHTLQELVRDDGTTEEPSVVSSDTMKGIRLAELPNGRVAMFTRPQGGEYGPGKICYRELDSLEDFTTETMAAPEEVLNLFAEGEWGGPNEVHVLKNGKLGVLGHIARFAPKDPSDPKSPTVKHYYAMTFCFDPSTKEASDMKIIATADSFPGVESKKDDLGGIIYSGGLKRLPNGAAALYCGVGDVTAGMLWMEEDPLLEYERDPGSMLAETLSVNE
jgi:hypothetical protein